MENIPNALLFLKNLVGDSALKEIDLFMKDQISSWRSDNLLRILKNAEGRKILDAGGRIMLNPKLLVQIVESGSLEENVDIQDMWAGLLVSSINDENILFVDMLKGLSPFQSRVLRCAVKEVKTITYDNGLIYTAPARPHQPVMMDQQGLCDLYGYPSSVQVIDRELDSLREKGLIVGGFDVSNSESADVTPTPLCLHFIARCDGAVDSVAYYKYRISQKDLRITQNTNITN
jgi:hypothetical protein